MKCTEAIYLLVIMFVFVGCIIDLPTSAQEITKCYKKVNNQPVTFSILHTYEDQQGSQIIELPYNAFQNSSNQHNISIIQLNYCQINRVHPDAFLNLSHLEYLDFGENKIHDPDSKIFQHVQQIKNIYLYSNMIKTLPAGLFENLVLLERVSLYFNQIEFIESGAFNNVPSLRYIDLSFNELQYLDPSVAQSFSHTSDIQIYGNPWTCDCNLMELRDLFSKGQLAYYYPPPKCENPLEFRGQKWADLPNDVCKLQIIMPTNNTKVVQADTNVTLTCKVHSHYKPDMNWYKDSDIIEAQYLSSSSSSQIYYLNYTFTVHEYNAGAYYCIANNSASRQESNITLGVYRKTEKPIATATDSKWMPWKFTFDGKISVVGTMNISGPGHFSSEENPLHILFSPQVSENNKEIKTTVKIN